MSCGDYYYWAVDPTDAETLEAYLNQGGAILLEGEDVGYTHGRNTFMANVAHAIYQMDSASASALTVVDPSHPITIGLPASFNWATLPPYPDGVNPTNKGVAVVNYTGTNWAAITVYTGTEKGIGSVVYYSFPFYCLAQTERNTLVMNSVCWLLGLSTPARHEIAITSVEPHRTVVAQNSSTNMRVTVANLGNFMETVNVTVYINSHLIGIQTPSLDSGRHTKLTFAWSTANVPKGNYTIKAIASTVQNETYTANNAFTDGLIKISIKGDINADGKVDIKDIAAAAKAFGTGPGDIKWQANADINEDQQIDIRDIAAIAKEFGKTDP